VFNILNAELNPICHLLALLGAHHIFHVSGLRVKRLRKVSTTETLTYIDETNKTLPIPVAARSKAWVCSRSLAGIVGSISARGMDVCLF
jgi:hypothetical protein